MVDFVQKDCDSCGQAGHHVSSFSFCLLTWKKRITGVFSM